MGALTHWRIFRKFYLVAISLLLILLIGIAGFVFIEGWSFIDALYMTVITITSVGFGEVNELSESGRWFTIFLILGTFGTFAYLITLVTSLIASGELGRSIKKYRTMQEMEKMQEHIIVCGLGRVGNQVVRDLIKADFKVVAIDSNPNRLLFEHPNLIAITGDATKDEDLEKVGITRAKSIVVCLPADADNLFVVLTAKSKNKQIHIISRASQKTSCDKLKIAGADHVIMPDSIGGTHMASLVSSPEVIEFLDQIRTESRTGANIESIPISQLQSETASMKTLGELEIKRNTGATIIGIKSKNGDFIINPEDTIPLEELSSLLVLGNANQIEKVNQFFNINTTK